MFENLMFVNARARKSSESNARVRSIIHYFLDPVMEKPSQSPGLTQRDPDKRDWNHTDALRSGPEWTRFARYLQVHGACFYEIFWIRHNKRR